MINQNPRRDQNALSTLKRQLLIFWGQAPIVKPHACSKDCFPVQLYNILTFAPCSSQSMTWHMLGWLAVQPLQVFPFQP
jgi:hypothetical protein